MVNPALPPVLSFTERDANVALRTFLLGLVASGTEVVRGQVNRVPEPRGADFVVFWPLRRDRLGTNLTTYLDTEVVASIAGSVLTVTGVLYGVLTPGLTLYGTGAGPAANTALGAQLTGSLGGTGTYAVIPVQTLASSTVFVGERDDLAATDMVVQVDIHGPSSADNAQRLDTLLRSEYGTRAFGTVAVAPLYCDSPRQLPFLDAEQQVEDRWSVDVHLQLSAVVSTTQQFADQLEPTLIDVDATFPP